ncbi:tetratricopeptide repeat protein [Soonwooa sp.]|uniref:tetratricopeptide repeat protein n=1 Tax=Soonwooa sp. TaxID=1938592 RepID=UPI00260A033A|nr:tetratricopeptide repeat protein [Soonwooa sp.]
MTKFLSLIFLLPFFGFSQNFESFKNLNETQKQEVLKILQDDSQASLFSIKHQKNLDKLLEFMPNEAFLWQQKAMPLFKQRKYELGMQYLDKAVALDKTNHYREYRAFIKCAFQKNYQEALREFFELSKTREDGVVMDHPYTFWMALCYLQMNDFDQAKLYLNKTLAFSVKHSISNPYEYFYQGIVAFETRKYQDAIGFFNQSLKEYPNFSDAKYYKSISLMMLNKVDEAKSLLSESETDFRNSYTFIEANSIYEPSPYQVSAYIFEYTKTLFNR